MTDSYDLYLRPKQLSGLWGVKPRQTQRILGEIEAMGYSAAPDGNGARRLHPEVAHAVKACRERQADLLTLRLNHELDRHLQKGRAAEPDPLEVLIEVAAELAIVREVAGTLAESARAALGPGWREPLWSGLSLPFPRQL